MYARFFAFGFITICLTACGAKKNETAVQEKVLPPTAELELQNQEHAEIAPQETNAINEVMEPNCLPLTTDVPDELEDWNPTEILTITKDGNCLSLSFQHSGCNEGAPKLILSKTNHYELLVAGAGPCEMLIESSAAFDIASLALPPGKQTIMVGNQKINFQIP